jgi:RNA polymerase sigma factor (sigma-70 family)
MQNIEEIYKEHSNAVYKYLFCLTGSEDLSEELTQETFAIAVKEIKKFKGNCKVSVWLCQIAKHLWYKELKKKKNISIEEIEDLQETETVEDFIFKKEDKIKLFKDIQKLDEKSRELIYLRMVGNLDFTEIGEILGKTPNWARVNFYRAKQKIREVNKNGKEN